MATLSPRSPEVSTSTSTSGDNHGRRTGFHIQRRRRQSLDLLETSGVLNPNLTLDKLMEVTRQLAEFEPTIIPGMVNTVTINVFLHNQFCYVIAR